MLVLGILEIGKLWTVDIGNAHGPAMPRSPSLFASSTSASPLSSLHQPHHHLRAAYGLLEPQPIVSSQQPFSPKQLSPVGADRRKDRTSSSGSPPQPNFLPPRRLRRKSGSFGRSVGRVVPAWSEVEAGFDVLKDCSVELGANLGAFGGKLSDTVPGVRGSVAFLSILRSNIQISTGVGSASPRLRPLPLSGSSVFSQLTVSSPIVSSMSRHGDTDATADPAEVPELVYETPTTAAARIDGLHLVADSVAQMRQAAAAKMIASSPLSLILLLTGLSLAWLLQYKNLMDSATIFTTAGGLVMSFFVAVRMVLKGYLLQAEAIDFAWLGEDHLLIARFGTDIIGALVYHVADSEETAASATGAAAPSELAKSMRRKAVAAPATQVAEVRGWTVRRRERGHGVGKALLEAGVKICLRSHRCRDVVFADKKGQRAGAERVLAPWLARLTNVESMLVANEARADACLKRVVEQEKER